MMVRCRAVQTLSQVVYSSSFHKFGFEYCVSLETLRYIVYNVCFSFWPAFILHFAIHDCAYISITYTLSRHFWCDKISRRSICICDDGTYTHTSLYTAAVSTELSCPVSAPDNQSSVILYYIENKTIISNAHQFKTTLEKLIAALRHLTETHATSNRGNSLISTLVIADTYYIFIHTSFI